MMNIKILKNEAEYEAALVRMDAADGRCHWFSCGRRTGTARCTG